MPQGRGKLERFFCTVRFQFLSGFKGNILRDINEALECWIRDVCHQRKHLGTGQAPLQRFTSKMRYIKLGLLPTGKATSEKEPRGAWPGTSPFPWPAGYIRPQCL
ncbi:hypothetical protein DFAR_3400006 [Desulfarculales bacterium]